MGLSHKEVMESSWIVLQCMMNDFPYYDPKAKKVIKGKAAEEHLDKYTRE